MHASQAREFAAGRRIDPTKIENIVISGGGGAGRAFAGALKGLNLRNIKRAAGTSVGAVAALAICLRLTPEQMFERLGGLDFKRITEKGSWSSLFWRIAKQQSLCSGEYIYQEILKLLREVIGERLDKDPAIITFADLHELGYGDLYVVTSQFFLAMNPETQLKEGQFRKKIYSYETTPNASVARAILASTAVPHLFPSVEIDGIQHVDGGMTDIFPMEIFHYRKYRENAPIVLNYDEEGRPFSAEMNDYEKPSPFFPPEERVYNPYTLGLTLRPSAACILKPLSGIHPLYEAQATINGFLDHHQNGILRRNPNVVVIPRRITLTDFDIDEETHRAVIEDGSLAVRRHFGIEKKEEDSYAIPRAVSFYAPHRKPEQETSSTSKCEAPSRMLAAL